MYSAMWVAKTGLDAQHQRLSVISNNLANVSTNGFKRGRAVFEDLMYQNVRQAGAQSSQDTQLPSGLSLGTGVRMVATEKIHTQGNFAQTGNSLDLAIQGRGFLQILAADGSMAYTRNGALQVDSQGQIVTSQGYPMQPAISVPADATGLTIGLDGTVTVQQAGSATPSQIGSIQLADFVNPTGLQPVGENLFRETAASGSPQVGAPNANGIGSINQGSLETSNVNVVEELVDMIEAQRAYELNSKAIATSDQMLQYINNNL